MGTAPEPEFFADAGCTPSEGFQIHFQALETNRGGRGADFRRRQELGAESP
jgi:hypothetical protein